MIALAIGLLALCAILFPLAPIDPSASVSAALVAYAFAYAAVSACVLAAGASAPDLGRGAAGIVVVGALLLASLASSTPTALHAALVLACLLTVGTSAGAAVGSRIESAGHLLPVAIVTSLADVVSVLTPGAPSDVIADTPAWLSVLAISWPMPGTSDLPAILGVGDVVFVALYFGAARKHHLPLARTALALTLGLAITAAVVAATSLAIPALPFIGGAMVLAHPAARQLPMKDRRPATIGIVVILFALGALVLSRRPW